MPKLASNLYILSIKFSISSTLQQITTYTLKLAQVVFLHFSNSLTKDVKCPGIINCACKLLNSNGNGKYRITYLLSKKCLVFFMLKKVLPKKAIIEMVHFFNADLCFVSSTTPHRFNKAEFTCTHYGSMDNSCINFWTRLFFIFANFFAIFHSGVH